MTDYTDLTARLLGEYRIRITDGLGPVGGAEPDNSNEFVRHFPVPPINKEAAGAIKALVRERDEALALAESRSCTRGQRAEGTQFCALAVDALKERDEARAALAATLARETETQRRHDARMDALTAEVVRLREAIKWALGEDDSDFGDHKPPNAPPYWWRKELRARAALNTEKTDDHG